MGIEYDELKTLNPKFKGEIAPLKAGKSLELKIPLGSTQAAIVAAQDAAVAKVEYVADAGDTQIHRVRSGESLSTIAQRYRTTVTWLRNTNNLKKGRVLRIGQRISVPERGGKKPTVVKYTAKAEKIEKQDVEKATVNAEIVTKSGVFYLVQPGDTLSGIADDYSSSVEELRRMNKMSRGSMLKAGMRLKVPKDEGLPADPSGTKASARQLADKEASKEENLKERTAAAREPQTDIIGPAKHVVRPGENLTTIAKKYGVTIQSIRKANNLNKRSLLKVGSRLLIPEDRPQSKTNNKSQRPALASQKSTEIASKKTRVQRPRVHIVKPGENLTVIAEKYSIPLQSLRQENKKIGQRSKLYVGSKLMIPDAQAN